MKKVLLLTLVMVLGASLAVAQPGVFGTYADPGAANCNIVDAGGLMLVWIVHTLTGGATAGQFWAPLPACAVGVTYIADGAPIGPAVGDTQTGLAIGYGGCLGAPIAVVNVTCFASGLSGTCCQYPVLPDPNTGLIEMVDCTATKLTASGLSNTINGNATCDCNTVPTQESTWGAVKSLYHNE